MCFNYNHNNKNLKKPGLFWQVRQNKHLIHACNHPQNQIDVSVEHRRRQVVGSNATGTTILTTQREKYDIVWSPHFTTKYPSLYLNNSNTVAISFHNKPTHPCVWSSDAKLFHIAVVNALRRWILCPYILSPSSVPNPIVSTSVQT